MRKHPRPDNSFNLFQSRPILKIAGQTFTGDLESRLNPNFIRFQSVALGPGLGFAEKTCPENIELESSIQAWILSLSNPVKALIEL